MKKSLIAAAVLATAGMASAQSSVTLFGIVDTALQHGTGSISDKTRLHPNGSYASRLGFRGTEDLGGGLSAGFWLEGAINGDDGTSVASNTNNQASGGGPALAGSQGFTFMRRSTLSLAGSWGELRLGRDINPQYYNLSTFDPFGAVGVGASLTNVNPITGVVKVRSSNSIGYFLPPKLGGFYGQAMYYLGENNTGTATEDDGTGAGVRLGYASGPINVAIAVSRTQYAGGDVEQNNIGGSYDFKVVKLMAQYGRDKNGSVNARGYQLTGVVPVGVGEIKAGYTTYRTDAPGEPEARKVAVGYVHNLSKRTGVYVHFARLKNSGGASFALQGATTAPNTSSSGYDIGIRHSF